MILAPCLKVEKFKRYGIYPSPINVIFSVLFEILINKIPSLVLLAKNLLPNFFV